ncbi:MAG TPA: fumarate/nitrate reduction transcriptional regulator Fnr [Pseudomonadales bacterium]
MTDAACPHQSQMSCNECRLGKICLPVALNANDIVRLDEIVKRGRITQKGEHIYRTNDPFHAVFAIRSGYVKTYRITDDGEEQITGFYFPGEVFGMDGINKHKYTNSAKALESTAICEIPFARFQELTSQLPSLQMHFFQLMSQEITTDQQLITMLSKKTAEQRVATLLLTISARNAHRSQSATAFRLAMSRTDIGNYLGLTVETVSRTLSRFSKMDLIDLDQKEVRLLDVEGLRVLANLDE